MARRRKDDIRPAVESIVAESERITAAQIVALTDGETRQEAAVAAALATSSAITAAQVAALATTTERARQVKQIMAERAERLSRRPPKGTPA